MPKAKQKIFLIHSFSKYENPLIYSFTGRFNLPINNELSAIVECRSRHFEKSRYFFLLWSA